jgi:hypothetical protein
MEVFNVVYKVLNGQMGLLAAHNTAAQASEPRAGKPISSNVVSAPIGNMGVSKTDIGRAEYPSN